jgi:ABC-type antimicrobial peptide transport system permease subunit
MKNDPPKIFLGFFRWYCHPKFLDHIEGDLIEVHHQRLKKYGKRKADIKFVIDVLWLFRPSIIKPTEGYQNLNYGIYKSYFKIGWRNLLKNKGYSFINIGGLAMAMAVAMLIGLWIYDELSFDRYHQNYDHIGQVIRDGSPYLPFPLADELKTKYGGSFKQVAMAWPVGVSMLSVADKKSYQQGEFIETNALEMFSLKMLQGSWSALKDPHSIIISSSVAHALFAEQDPIGQLLKIDNEMDVKVTGVYEDLPLNTQFHEVQFFAPWDLFVSDNKWIKGQGFLNNFLKIYVEIQPTTDFQKVSEAIKDAILNNVRANKEYSPQLFLHPMSKWHLYSEWKNGKYEGGLIQFVWLYGVIGFFVLLLACINFMNLSTARSEKRMKEVGIRKVLGSERKHLIYQFFSESFTVVSMAFIVSLCLVVLSLGWFNELAGKEIRMPLKDLYFWTISLGFVLVTGIIAGSYPALYLSSFLPVKVLKGVFRVGRFASIPRKVLVVLQFTVSVTLIISTIIVYQQIKFAKNRPVGYTRERLIMIQMTTADFYGKTDLLRSELQSTGAVDEIAESIGPATEIRSNNGGFNWKGKDPSLNPEFATLTVTPEYGNTVGWQLIDGRDFLRDLASDSSCFVVNESAAKLFNFDNPIGELVRWNPRFRKPDDFKIIGVVKDMVMKSPFELAKPTVFFMGGQTNWINIKINPNANIRDALAFIEGVFKKAIPSVLFTYKFADEEYALKFKSEERIGKLASVFAALAIFISCLGLLGLASFVAEQRTKEIGIRKVMGASVLTLWKMLSKDFVLLVVISILISIPSAYYFMNNWLQKYEYRTEILWWVFSVSGAGALMITLLTVSYQSIKAAKANPVNSLRSE